MRVARAETAEDLAVVRELFQEYWNSFGFTPCFQGFGAELAGLPGPYAPPGGGLALASVDGRTAGCAAYRRLDDERCEAKRLYVRPEFRRQGIGRALLDWVMKEARRNGYREIVGDTMPVMERALEMYARAGFERTGPYSATPTEGAIYLRFRLS
jgi:putative acetyltransferase